MTLLYASSSGHLSTRITAESIDHLGDPDGDHNARLIHACWHLGRPTGIPVPLSQRLTRPRPADRLHGPWTCSDCGTHTRLAICPSCQEHRQPRLDTKPAKRRAGTFYQGLRRWAHMLGFGGHFLTKARHHRVTFGLLRNTRTAFRRHSEREHQTGRAIRAVDHTEETTLIVGVLSYAGTSWHTTGDALLATTAADQARRRHQAGREELDHEIGTAISDAARAA